MKEQGVEAAKAYMRSIRARVKTVGLANVPKSERSAIAKKGWETKRRAKNKKGQS